MQTSPAPFDEAIDSLIQRQALPRLGTMPDVFNCVDFFLDEKSGVMLAKPFTSEALPKPENDPMAQQTIESFAERLVSFTAIKLSVMRI